MSDRETSGFLTYSTMVILSPRRGERRDFFFNEMAYPRSQRHDAAAIYISHRFTRMKRGYFAAQASSVEYCSTSFQLVVFRRGH